MVAAAMTKRSNKRITLAMIEAGFSVLSFRYDPDACDRDRRAVVRDMYRAMILARPEDSADSN
jgi:hypothetical protein